MASKKIDIALIQPPGWAVQNPSLGLALLKSYLSEQGLSATVFDLNILLYNLRYDTFRSSWDIANGYYTWERESFIHQLFSFYSHEILNFIYSVLSTKPEVIGFSAHSSSFIATKVLAGKFREYAPDTPLICGGPNVAWYTDNWRSLLDSHVVDAVIFGEGEASLTEYLQSREKLTSQKIAGVAYRDKSGQIIDGGNRPLIDSLDSLPFADFSDFNLSLYAGTNVIPTYFSRGCVNNCIFCTERNYFPKFRNRSGQRLFDEIVYQLSRYPQTEAVRLHDSVSNGNIRELEKFCDLMIKNRIKISWNLENAIIRKEMDPALYKKLKKAGCTLIGYGMETPSKKLLKSIGKTACQTADFDKVISDGVRAKITLGINMMFGLPGETEDDFQGQLEFLRRHRKHRNRIIINPALNFCYIPKGCAIAENPDKFDINISMGEVFWSSKDGKNTFFLRMERFEKFCAYADKLGYKNLFNITQLINRNEQIGNYYIKEGNVAKGLSYLLTSFNVELKTADLAKEIISIYEKLDLPKDDTYHVIEQYRIKSDTDEARWFDTPDNYDELENFLLSSFISARISRLNLIVASMNPQHCEFAFSIEEIKKFLKYQFSKWVGISDTRYVILLQVLMEMDNKLKVLEHQNDKRNQPKLR
jgi:radical SAM superfamily enzyme YgiQ (UPF0313 family)